MDLIFLNQCSLGKCHSVFLEKAISFSLWPLSCETPGDRKWRSLADGIICDLTLRRNVLILVCPSNQGSMPRTKLYCGLKEIRSELRRLLGLFNWSLCPDIVRWCLDKQSRLDMEKSNTEQAHLDTIYENDIAFVKSVLEHWYIHLKLAICKSNVGCAFCCLQGKKKEKKSSFY